MISTEVHKAAGSMTLADLKKYIDRAYLMLSMMAPGRKRIDDMARAETRGLFIEVIKQYMREMPWQGHLSFNEDFSAIIKHDVSGPWMKELIKENNKPSENE